MVEYNNLEESAEAKEARQIAEEAEFGGKLHKGGMKILIAALAAAWSLFQLSLASIIMLDSVIVRAVHLTFAITLVFLSYPFFRKPKKIKLLNYLARWYEAVALGVVTFVLLRPYYVVEKLLNLPLTMLYPVSTGALVLYGLIWLMQKRRLKGTVTTA